MKSLQNYVHESLNENSELRDLQSYKILNEFADSVLSIKELNYSEHFLSLAKKIVPNILDIMKSKGKNGLTIEQLCKLYLEFYYNDRPYSHQFFKKYHQNTFSDLTDWCNKKIK